MAAPLEIEECGSRAAWREWLVREHARSPGVRLLFYKKQLLRSWLQYEEAVEEAICFGWIDSIVSRRDAESYLQRFVPRAVNTRWSETNLRRARRVIDAGLMTAAGLARLGPALEQFEQQGIVYRPPRIEEAPEELLALLRVEPVALQAFEALPPSHRRQYLGWILEAKRPATRLRRMQELGGWCEMLLLRSPLHPCMVRQYRLSRPRRSSATPPGSRTGTSFPARRIELLATNHFAPATQSGNSRPDNDWG